MPVQILAASHRGPPRITVRDEAGNLATLPLDGPFSWRLGRVRRCVGRLDDDGRHVPCPTGEPVGAHRQCAACSGLDDLECVFEPRCRDNPSHCACLGTFRDVPHVVYVAFHGSLPKVGLTVERRVEDRLREQGADAWLVALRTQGRGEARAHEQRLSVLFGIPEHRSHRETLPQLARPVPWDIIESRAEALRHRLAGAYDLEPALHRITDHPLAQPLGSVPRRVGAAGSHRGHWLGCKGNHLVYREAPRPDRLDLALARPLVALKRTDLVGRGLERLD